MTVFNPRFAVCLATCLFAIGCGGEVDARTVSATEELSPTALLDRMESAFDAYPSYHVERTVNGKVELSGDFDLGPPLRMSGKTGTPGDLSVAFVVVDTIGQYRPLKPKVGRWVGASDEVVAQITQDVDIRTVFAVLREGAVNVQSVHPALSDGDFEVTLWAVDLRKYHAAVGLQSAEGTPDRQMFRVSIDQRGLVRVVEVPGATVTYSRWGEPVDLVESQTQ